MILYLAAFVFAAGGVLFADAAHRMHRAEDRFNRAEAIYTRLTHERKGK